MSSVILCSKLLNERLVLGTPKLLVGVRSEGLGTVTSNFGFFPNSKHQLKMTISANFKERMQSGRLAHACDSSTREAEAVGLQRGPGQPWLYSLFQASPNYKARHCLKGARGEKDLIYFTHICMIGVFCLPMVQL